MKQQPYSCGRKKGLSARYEQIAPMVRSAYGEGRTIREIMQAFSIPSSATVYKIVSASRQATASAARPFN
ncbi:hypothetical protein VF13_34675 [Nostoc linckia z16]|nr:hypothetical protein VF13_34675 [Nostoc linckia z16]